MEAGPVGAFDVSDGCIVIGAVLVIVGLGLIYLPLALVALGLGLAAGGVLIGGKQT
jgi:hypothetical protein